MRITFNTLRARTSLATSSVSVSGDVLTVDGEDFDLSSVPEGGRAVPQGRAHPFVGPITRVDGEIVCTIDFFLGPEVATRQSIDPAHWTMQVSGGPANPALVMKPVPVEEIEEI